MKSATRADAFSSTVLSTGWVVSQGQRMLEGACERIQSHCWAGWIPEERGVGQQHRHLRLPWGLF